MQGTPLVSHQGSVWEGRGREEGWDEGGRRKGGGVGRGREEGWVEGGGVGRGRRGG